MASSRELAREVREAAHDLAKEGLDVGARRMARLRDARLREDRIDSREPARRGRVSASSNAQSGCRRREAGASTLQRRHLDDER
jgi:hypothetical protein